MTFDEGETEKGPSFVLFQLDGLFAVRGLSSVDKFEGRSFFSPRRDTCFARIMCMLTWEERVSLIDFYECSLEDFIAQAKYISEGF